MRRFMLLAALCAALVLALTPAVMAQTNQFNCSDFEFQEDAQEVFNQDTSDPNLLDEDDGVDDGIACENLPSRGTGTGATGSQYTQQPTATQYAPTTPAEAVDEETSSTTTTTPLPDTGGLPLVPLAGASLLVLGVVGLAMKRRIS